jgi:hypothetical protein
MDDDDEDDVDVAPVEHAMGMLPKIEARNYSLSVLLEHEKRGKIDLHPIFQRNFKWTQRQASLYVESMLLGYPCVPEIVLLACERGFYVVLDGQQRLTSTKHFVNGSRASHWVKTSAQRKQGTADTFALEGMNKLPALEGKTFKDLSDEYQTHLMDDFTFRCAIIPKDWPMSAYIDFFQRIQGGGTPMSMQELRRALSQGKFTTLLDELSDYDSKQGVVPKLLAQALAPFKLDMDEKQELLLRFFTLRHVGVQKFSTRNKAQLGLDVMKEYNRMVETKDGSRDVEEGTSALRLALTNILQVFQADAFKRARPLGRHASKATERVWSGSTHPNRSIWDCMLHVFGRYRELDITSASETLRDVLVDRMQNDPAFASMDTRQTEARMKALDDAILTVIRPSEVAPPVSAAARREMIASARREGNLCTICRQPLPALDDLIHVDHSQARSRGGSSQTFNLGCSHKICNLSKGAAEGPKRQRSDA